MAEDFREDTGEFYPGSKVVTGVPQQSTAAITAAIKDIDNRVTKLEQNGGGSSVGVVAKEFYGDNPQALNIYNEEAIVNIQNGGFYNIWTECVLFLPCVTRHPEIYRPGVNPNGNNYGVPIRFMARIASDAVIKSGVVFFEDAGRLIVTNLSENSYSGGSISAKSLGLSKVWKTVTLSVFPTDQGTEKVHLEVV